VDCFHDSEGQVPLVRTAQVQHVIYLGPHAIVRGQLFESHENIGGDSQSFSDLAYHKETRFLSTAFDLAPGVNVHRAAIAGFLDCQSGGFPQSADSGCECREVIHALSPRQTIEVKQGINHTR
jgi:hypothetical protein